MLIAIIKDFLFMQYSFFILNDNILTEIQYFDDELSCKFVM